MISIQTRVANTASDDPAEEIVYDGEKKVTDEDEVYLEEEDADEKVKAAHQGTQIKSH